MIKKYTRKQIIWLLLLGLISSWPACVTAGPGSCEQFEFPLSPEGELDWPHAVKVLRQGSVVYADAYSDELQQNSLLNFNQNVKVLEERGTRLLLRPLDSQNPLGWVERRNLLCSVSPLRAASGLEQKFYALSIPKTPGGRPQKPRAHQSPDINEKPAKGETLKEFTGYFVFDRDEAHQSYLVAEPHRLDEVSELLGWVDAKKGRLWDSAYGIRPESESAICAYTDLEDAVKQEHCLPILGGTRWYRLHERLPLLERLEYEGTPFYKVLLSFYQIVLPFERLYQHVNVAYIPASEEIVEDVWLTSSDVEKWKDLLQAFDSLENLSGTELRTAFVNGLTKSIERTFRKTLHGNTRIPLSDFLQRACGLAVRHDSPLFRYSIDELSDPSRVPDCEVSRLALWGKSHGDMLDIVSYGTERPVYTLEKSSDECPSAAHIPVVTGEIEAHLLGDAEMRYDYSMQKVHAYWVPKEFLP